MIDDKQVTDIVKNLGYITVKHMSLSIDINRLFLEDYPSAEKDLCVYLVQGYYNKIAGVTGRELSTDEKERALIYAKYNATRRLTTELKGLVDRSTLFILVDAQTTGWHQAMEYDNIVELLSSIMEEKEGMDEAYDWRFIVEKLIPAVMQAQIPVDTIVNASLNVKKLRGLVPAARELLERQGKNEITPDEAKVVLNDWLVKTANPTISYPALHEELNDWRNKVVRQSGPLQGYKVMMPDGKILIVIQAESDREVSMVEQALKNRVDISVAGFDWIQEQVVSQMKESRLHELINN